MNPKYILQTIRPAVVAILLLVAGAVAHAANGWFTNSAGGLWGTTANWSNTVVAAGAGANAYFTNAALSAGYTVHLNSSRTNGNLFIGDAVGNSAHTWTLDDNGSAGANVLTLATTSGNTSTINLGYGLNASSVVTISCPIAGTNTLSKTAAGSTLYLTGANTFDGQVTVSQSGGAGNALYYNSVSDQGSGLPSALGEPVNSTGQINLGASCSINYNGAAPATTARPFNLLYSNAGINNAMANGGGALTLNGPITGTVTTGNPQLVFRCFNTTGNSIYINSPLTTNFGAFFIYGNGGDIYLTCPTNSFTNYVFSGSSVGTLNFSSITNGGLPCSVGAGTVVEGSAGKLVYTGTNSTSTDRTYIINGNNIQLVNSSPNGSILTWNGVVTNNVATNNGAWQAPFRGSAPIVLNGPVHLGCSYFLKADYNSITLNNPNNDFTNYVTLNAGSLYFSSITNGGLPCALGKGTLCYWNASFAPNYIYIGTNDTATDRTWTFANNANGNPGGGIINQGSGTLTLNGPINCQTASQLKAGVSFGGASNTLVSGAITLSQYPGYDPIVGVNYSGPGVLTLANAANVIPGALNISGGTLSVPSVAAMGGCAYIVMGGAGTGGANASVGTFQFTGASGASISTPINVVADLYGTGTNGAAIENTVAGQTLTLSGAVTPVDVPAIGNYPSDYSYPAYLTLKGAGNGVLSADITGSPILSVVKTGAGTWTLAGNNTYTGNTVVSNGTLVLNGTLGGGTTNATVVAGGKLAGVCTIADAVDVLSGGTLSPGVNDVPGTLTINNNLTLSGTVAVTLNKSLPQSSSLLAVSGTITNAGGASIAVSNVGPALAVGNSFALFSQAVSNGAAITISPAPGAGLAWQNNLALNGTISVVTSGPSGPAYITNSISGNLLALTWPSGQGWRLVSETNSLFVGLSTNGWHTVPGGIDGSNGITINPNNPSVFYKLVNP
ncbi:MAG: autotransporter-associated beta strand repeat-containing protein [Verrucomicrobiota bacterium]